MRRITWILYCQTKWIKFHKCEWIDVSCFLNLQETLFGDKKECSSSIKAREKLLTPGEVERHQEFWQTYFEPEKTPIATEAELSIALWRPTSFWKNNVLDLTNRKFCIDWCVWWSLWFLKMELFLWLVRTYKASALWKY